jgi:outer membrane protein TolC
MGLNQLVFDGTFFLGLKAAQEFVNISTLLVSQSEIDIKAGVLKSYYMALISQKNLGQLNKSLENLNKLKSETEALYTEGFAEKLDVDRLILSVSQLEISINNLKNQAELAKKLLLHSMGLDVNQELKLTSELPTLENGDFQESYPMTTDYAKRIEVQLLEQQQTLNQLNLKRYQMGYIPSIYLNANYGYNSFAQDGQFNQLGKDWYSMSSYGFNLNIPVFDGMYKKSKADQVRVDMMKMENTLEMAKNGIALEVAQAVISYENAYKNMQLQKQSMDLSLRIYNTTEVKFKEGIGSSFEMVTAERDLTMAQTNYLNALYELSVAKINLDIAYGNL